MTSTTATRPAAASGTLASAVRDGLVIMWRNLKRVPRIPELAIFAVLQSIMFVLLFAYVFGGAIPIHGGGDYTDFLTSLSTPPGTAASSSSRTRCRRCFTRCPWPITAGPRRSA